MNSRLFCYILLLFIVVACAEQEKKVETTLKTTVSTSKTDVVGLDNGRWIRTDDPTSGIEIKDGEFIMFNEISNRLVTTIYRCELTEKEGVEYLNLEASNGKKIVYGLLEYSDEEMVIDQLGRGNTLTYRKEN